VTADKLKLRGWVYIEGSLIRRTGGTLPRKYTLFPTMFTIKRSISTLSWTEKGTRGHASFPELTVIVSLLLMTSLEVFPAKRKRGQDLRPEPMPPCHFRCPDRSGKPDPAERCDRFRRGSRPEGIRSPMSTSGKE